MIKKLLATALATLSVASMSLPAMAIKTTDVNKEQHENYLYSQQSNNIDDDFEIIEKEKKIITKYDTGELPLFEEKEVKADGASDNFKFTELSADEEQRKAIDEENNRIIDLQEGDKSAGYLAIKRNMISLHNEVSHTKDAIKKFDASTATSKAGEVMKNAGYIVGDVFCYPVSGGLRYAYDNGMLSKACGYVKDKVVDYGLNYIGLKKDSKKDGKIAKAFKFCKSIYNYCTSNDEKNKS